MNIKLKVVLFVYFEYVQKAKMVIKLYMMDSMGIILLRNISRRVNEVYDSEDEDDRHGRR